jgi:hypothetical protein
LKKYESKVFKFWTKFFLVGDFLKIEYFTDAFFNIKFIGVCIDKTHRGLGSTVLIGDRDGFYQRFYVYSLYLKKITVFGKFKKKYYKI